MDVPGSRAQLRSTPCLPRSLCPAGGADWGGDSHRGTAIPTHLAPLRHRPTAGLLCHGWWHLAWQPHGGDTQGHHSLRVVLVPGLRHRATQHCWCQLHSWPRAWGQVSPTVPHIPHNMSPSTPYPCPLSQLSTSFIATFLRKGRALPLAAVSWTGGGTPIPVPQQHSPLHPLLSLGSPLSSPSALNSLGVSPQLQPSVLG